MDFRSGYRIRCKTRSTEKWEVYVSQWDSDMGNEKTPRGLPWWVARKFDLLAIASDVAPAIVYDDETFNETFFDLLCVQGVHTLLYSVKSNAHVRVLEKILKLGGLFKCSSQAEIDYLGGLYPPVPLDNMLVDARWLPDEYVRNSGQKVKAILAPITQYPVLTRCNINTFLSFDLSEEWISSNKSERGKLGLQRAAEILGIDAVRVKGVHIASSKEVSGKSEHVLELTWTIKKLFPEVHDVVLSRGLAIVRDQATGYLDFKSIRKRYDTLSREFPGLRFWLDPEDLAIEHAGGLLMKVQNAKESTEGMVVEVGLPVEFFLPFRKRQVLSNIYNLSTDKLLRGDLDLCNRYMGPQDRAVLRVKGRVTKGDLIFIGGFGALGMRLDRGSLGLHVHYLRARKMCAVKL